MSFTRFDRQATVPVTQGPRAQPLTAPSQGAGQAAAQLTDAARRVVARNDSTAVSKGLSEFTTGAQDRLRSFESDRDITDDNVRREYNQELQSLRNEILDARNLSPAGRTQLTNLLEQQDGVFRNAMAARSVKAGRDALDAEHRQRLNSIATSIISDPALSEDPVGTIQRGIDDSGAALDIVRGGMVGAQEEFWDTVGRQEVMISAVGELIDRNNLEAAQVILNDETFAEVLEPQQRLRLQERIDTFESTENQISAAINGLERAGVNVTPELRQAVALGLLGVDSRVLGGAQPLSAAGRLAVDMGADLSTPEGQEILSNIVAQQNRPEVVGTPPPGFELQTTDEGLRLVEIPGGPAEAERLASEEAARTRQLGEQEDANTVIRELDRSLNIIEASRQSGIPVSGLAGLVLSYLPGTDAFQLRANLLPVLANIGFAELQQLRDSSPTGGALGQVSNRENSLLQGVKGNLTLAQDEEVLEENLLQLREIWVRTMFGTDEEREAAIEAGKMSQAEADDLKRQSEEFGFDQVGRLLGGERQQAAEGSPERTEGPSVDEISQMSTDEAVALANSGQTLTAEQNSALRQRLERALQGPDNG